MNTKMFPIEIVPGPEGWDAKCPELHLSASGLTRDQAEARIIVLVYRHIADRISANAGDVPISVGEMFLVAAVSVLRKALDGSEAEKAYAKALCDALGNPEFVDLSAIDILAYDPNSDMTPRERIALVLAAHADPSQLN